MVNHERSVDRATRVTHRALARAAIAADDIALVFEGAKVVVRGRVASPEQRALVGEIVRQSCLPRQVENALEIAQDRAA